MRRNETVRSVVPITYSLDTSTSSVRSSLLRPHDNLLSASSQALQMKELKHVLSSRDPGAPMSRQVPEIVLNFSKYRNQFPSLEMAEARTQKQTIKVRES